MFGVYVNILIRKKWRENSKVTPKKCLLFVKRGKKKEFNYHISGVEERNVNIAQCPVHSTYWKWLQWKRKKKLNLVFLFREKETKRKIVCKQSKVAKPFICGLFSLSSSSSSTLLPSLSIVVGIFIPIILLLTPPQCGILCALG